MFIYMFLASQTWNSLTQFSHLEGPHQTRWGEGAASGHQNWTEKEVATCSNETMGSLVGFPSSYFCPIQLVFGLEFFEA